MVKNNRTTLSSTDWVLQHRASSRWNRNSLSLSRPPKKIQPPFITILPRPRLLAQKSNNPITKNIINHHSLTATATIFPSIAGRIGFGFFARCPPISSSSSSSSSMGSNSRRRRDLASKRVAAGGDGIKGGGGELEIDGSARLMTLPTVLTLGRVAAVPLLVSTFYLNGWWATTATTGIFIVAAITDWLDGYLARKMQLGTVFGAFLDPVADKLMVAATLVLLCTKPLKVSMFGEVCWLITAPSIAIIGREITMSAVREWAASQNGKLLKAVAVNSLGKWKTATQMTALTILLAARDPSLAWPDFLVASGVALLYISAGLALWSLAVYMRKIWRVLLK